MLTNLNVVLKMSISNLKHKTMTFVNLKITMLQTLICTVKIFCAKYAFAITEL